MADVHTKEIRSYNMSRIHLRQQAAAVQMFFQFIGIYEITRMVLPLKLQFMF